MTAQQISERYGGSWLLGLLRLCGWQVWSTDEVATLVARRADVEVSVEESSFEAAIAVIFVEAMRAGAVTGRPSIRLSQNRRWR